MKTENLVILAAFVVGVIIIFSFSQKSKNAEEETLNPKTVAEQQKAKPHKKGDDAELVERLSQEKNILEAKVKALEKALAQSRKKQTTDEIPNFFDTNVNQKTLPKTNSFGVYDSHISHVKAFINYAKTHKVPANTSKSQKEFAEMLSKIPKVRNTAYYSNMNVINFSDGFYVKMLQNMVAIYGPCSYHLDFTLTGEATCVGKNQKGYQECQKLGGKNGERSNRIPSWVAYKLPQNIFANKF